MYVSMFWFYIAVAAYVVLLAWGCLGWYNARFWRLMFEWVRKIQSYNRLMHFVTEEDVPDA